MINDAQILHAEFDKLKAELIAKHNELGMKASGKWIASLENKSKRLSGVLMGAPYTEHLELGRRPTDTKTAGPRKLSEIIEDWIEAKGIKPKEDKMKTSTLAFLIARKIHKEGWKRKDHGGVELVSQVITPQRIQQIIDKVSEFHINSFTNEIYGMFKQLEAA